MCWPTIHQISFEDAQINFDVHRLSCAFNLLEPYYASSGHDTWLVKFLSKKPSPNTIEEDRNKQNTDYSLSFSSTDCWPHCVPSIVVHWYKIYLVFGTTPKSVILLRFIPGKYNILATLTSIIYLFNVSGANCCPMKVTKWRGCEAHRGIQNFGFVV